MSPGFGMCLVMAFPFLFFLQLGPSSAGPWRLQPLRLAPDLARAVPVPAQAATRPVALRGRFGSCRPAPSAGQPADVSPDRSGTSAPLPAGTAGSPAPSVQAPAA